MRCLSLSGLCWAKKIGIFILGTLTIMTVRQKLFLWTFAAKTYNCVYWNVSMPSILIDLVEKFVWAPAPFQSPSIGLGSKETTTPKSSATLNNGSHGIEPKRDWNHFLKIGLVVAGGGFSSYCNLKCIKLGNEKIIFEKKNQFYTYKKHLKPFLKMGSITFWVQFHAYLADNKITNYHPLFSRNYTTFNLQ